MSDNIKVAIRVRPLIAREIANNANVYWEVKNKKTVAQVKEGSAKFSFDRVFKTEDKNHDVYENLCQPIVKSVIQGFNGTIFAYGQTSSGKTFTMMGEHGGIYKGVIQYTIEDIFDMIQQMQDREFLLRVSVIEIYNEKVYDLLSSKNEDLKLLEDCYGVIKVNGLQEKIVQNADQIWDIMAEGQMKRRTGETEMNRVSSRSHFIFRMILESSLKGEEDAAVNVSQLNLVDLAGSENIKQTKSKGHQFKEGVHINLSLSTLSQVISQLSEKPDQFINYRDSKLTRLLQNSLGGNAVTAIICAVTPANIKETLSTLNFASRAKKIRNRPEKNEILTDQALLKQYANKIKKLSEQLEVSKAQGKELEEKTKQNESLKRQIETLKANFVSQTVESKTKATRRETWGGRLDSKRFFEPRNTPFYQMPQIMEEIEELNEANSESRDRFSKESSRYSRSSASFSFNHNFNNVVNIGIQTDLEWEDQNDKIEEAMTMITELRLHLTTLQSEFEELDEYTTLERQYLKAENELQVEIEALRKENSILKQTIEKSGFSSEEPQGSVSDSCKEHENIVENKLLENIDSVQDQEIFRHNSASIRLNDSLQSQKVISPKKETLLDYTTSTVFDESLKSNFLAFYDECVENENEAISKLKAEIESLKYDIEIKDKQITLLNDKISIKEQFITSLQDEISLGKSIDYPDPNIADKLSQVHQDCQTESHTPVKNVLHTEYQTTPNKLCEICSCDDSCIIKSPVKCNISGLNFEKYIQTSPIAIPYLSNLSTNHLINDIEVNNTYENQSTQVTPVKSKEFGLQFVSIKNSSEHYVQTSPFSKLLSQSDTDQYTQMGDSILGESNNSILEEKSVKTFIPQSSQTEEDIDKSNIACDETKVNNLLNNFSDEVKIIVKKIQDLKVHTINFMKTCTKTEYLRFADENVDNVNDDCPVSIHDELMKLEKLIMTLEYYIQNRDDDCDIVNNMLESKFQEILSLQSKLSETENSLNAKESQLSGVCTMFCDLKQYLSQFTHIHQVLNYVESRSKLYNFKSDTALSDSSNSCKAEYEIKLLKKLFMKLNSDIEENVSKMVCLSDELEDVKLELAAIKKEREMKLSLAARMTVKATKSTQTCDSGEFENDHEMLKLIKEINCLKEEIIELEQSNKYLKQKNEDLLNHQSDMVNLLESDLESAKSDWQIRTEMLVKDLEAKYEKELNDQDKKFTQELHERISDLREDHAKQIIALKEEMEIMKDCHKNELCEVQRQYENQLSSVDSEKQNLTHELKKKHNIEIQALRTKYSTKIHKCGEINTQLRVQVQHYKEEIEKLKKENPSNDTQVVQQLNEKITELSSERDSLKRKCAAADQQISELKGKINSFERKLKELSEESKQNANSNSKENEQMKRKLLYDLDQKKAKIMTLESNNASMLQEVKKLKEMLSSKSNVPCKCKNNSKEAKSDSVDENEDKNSGKNKIVPKNDLDGAAANQALKKSSHNDFETPKQTACEAERNCICIGGGSGPGNMVKNFWLEGIIHKKDKEISKLRKELTELNSQLKVLKTRPLITEDKGTEVKKAEKPKLPISDLHKLKVSNSPLQEKDENITVQMCSNPYQDKILHVQRKQNLKERNLKTWGKPYEMQKRECLTKENVDSEMLHEAADTDENRPRITNKYDAVKHLTDPECKQQ